MTEDPPPTSHLPLSSPGHLPCSSLIPLLRSSRRPSVSFGGFGLRGADFRRLTRSLGIELRPKDVDLFLQGVDANGTPVVFGALFPKASYAERIRADVIASQDLMAKGLWSATITLDAREELGTEDRPSVKRDTINRGTFNGCYSFNEHTEPGGRVHIVRCTERGMRNPLVRDIVHAWRSREGR